MRTLLVLPLLLVMARAAWAAEPPRTAPFRRVFVVVLENENATDAMNEKFLRELARKGALLTQYRALEHISQPNYLALTSGSTWGLTRPFGDRSVTFDTKHLGDLLEAKHMNWKTYAEGYPGDCFLGMTEKSYARRHVPFLSYRNIQDDKPRCNAHVVNADQMDRDLASGMLPEFALYVPDNRHNGHDTDVSYASKWLAKRFGPLLENRRFMDGTLFVVTFDEGRGRSDNRVYTVLVGDSIKPGEYANAYTHYDLLRTIEDAFALGTLGRNDARAKGLTGMWRAAPHAP